MSTMINGLDLKMIKKAGKAIREGKLVIFPTETVYGIGANGFDEVAVKNIFRVKGRASDNPLILHVGNFDMIDMVCKNINSTERRLIDTFFPGPLTVVLEKSDLVPDAVSGGLATVGVRMPNNEIARNLINFSGVPVAAPSANISGKPSGTCVFDIDDSLKDNVSFVIDGGSTLVGIESTVVRVVSGVVNILRPGKISLEDFIDAGFDAVYNKNIFNDVKLNDKVMSLGMKYKHYAPNVECLLIYSEDNEKFVSKVHEFESDYNILVVCMENNFEKFKNAISMGSSLEEVSHNIFHILRELDKTNYDLVIVEGVKKKGLGVAIMNRLIRACSYNYIYRTKDKSTYLENLTVPFFCFIDIILDILHRLKFR